MAGISLIVSVGIGLAAIFIINALVQSFKNASRPPLPPGPKGLPLVGNLNDMPKPGELEAEHWLKHKELYGPISSITVMGQTMVIVNDAQLAVDLLEKRSAKHSSRPKQTFAGEMIGWGNMVGLTPMNDRFRTYRKNMGRVIGSKTAAAQFNGMQEAEVGHFLHHILQSPEKLMDHIRREVGSIILKIAYGYTAEQFDDDILIDIAAEAMNNFTIAAMPGAFMVDIVPFLRYLPDWFPGAGFKKTAREWAEQLRGVAEKPYAFVKHQMAQGKDNSSFLSRLLQAGDSTPEEKFTNKYSAMALYVAGADTTVSALASFFLAMTLHPEAQRKAQEEIDRVVGNERLPSAKDRDNLPYVDAIVKEIHRLYTVAPVSLPHTSTEDDVFEGYFIPKDAMIVTNIWHFTHDESVYKDPNSFKPERFIVPDGEKAPTDPRLYAFGFGRRICPGRVLADNSLWLNVAQILAVFDISKKIDDNGQEVDVRAAFTPGLVSHPQPFETSVKPRSPEHEERIRSLEHLYPWEESHGKVMESIDC